MRVRAASHDEGDGSLRGETLMIAPTTVLHRSAGQSLSQSCQKMLSHKAKTQNTTADCFCRLGVRTGVGLACTRARRRPKPARPCQWGIST
eukprot:COSAG06_NODE_106_length_23773_cov_20.279083_2_plen_91_part_00